MMSLGPLYGPEGEPPADLLVDFFDNDSSGLRAIEAFAGEDMAKLALNATVAWCVAFRYSPQAIRGIPTPNIQNVTSDDMVDQLVGVIVSDVYPEGYAGLRNTVLTDTIGRARELKSLEDFVKTKDTYLAKRSVLSHAERQTAENGLIPFAEELHHEGESHLDQLLRNMRFVHEGGESNTFEPGLEKQLSDPRYLRSAYEKMGMLGLRSVGLSADTLKRLMQNARTLGLDGSRPALDQHS